MLRTAVLLVLLLTGPFALAEDGAEDMRFAMPAFAGGKQACGAQKMEVLRDRGNTVMSIVRADPAQPAFLAVGPARKQDRAVCVIELRFEQALEAAQTLGIDFVGSEMKTPGAVVRLSIELGKQKHVFDYPAGRMLDEASGRVLKRFQVVYLPAGTRKLRIAISGEARRIARRDSAVIGFEALNLCFITSEQLEEQPQFCGAPGFPNVQLAH